MAKKPSAAAVAQEDDDTGDVIHSDHQQPPVVPPHKRDRWNQWRSAHESAHNDQQRRPPAATQLQYTAWHLDSESRQKALNRHVETLKARQAGGGFWTCRCGQQNPLSDTAPCTRCQTPGPNPPRAFQAADPDDPNVVQGWKHIQRLGDQEHQDTSPDSEAEASNISATQSALEEERQKRFEESKQSRFVGFRKSFVKKHYTFDFPASRRIAPDIAATPPTSTQNKTSSSPQENGSDALQFRVRNTRTSVPLRKQSKPTQIPRQDQKDALGSVEPSIPPAARKGWARFTPAAPKQSSRKDEVPIADNPLPIRTARNGSRWTTEETKADIDTLTNEWTRWSQPQEAVPTKDHVTDSVETSTKANSTQNRMARRLQELEKEQDEKVAKRKFRSAQYDIGRESRFKQSKKRYLVEKQDVFNDQGDFDEVRRARQERKQKKKNHQSLQKGPPTPIYLPEFISVVNLAGALHIKLEDFINKMADLGFGQINNDHVLDAETAGLIASEFNFEPINEQAEKQDLVARPSAEDKSVLPPRPPVVTIMGHVDHGKTTLLDWLRKSSVAASEHGGMTQHIGAFSVPMASGRTITFLDTPGHAAFLDMRQRGATVTDIVILVVAADDSVKPQTIEALKHAQAAQVPIIVAVNKIDKDDADVDRVKQDLARQGLEIEDYGGDTQVVYVSGKTGKGMETLEESVITLADVLDMRAEVDGAAEGWVLEATTKKAGRVATILVRRGTLHPGDVIVAGTTWTRVRTLRNEAGISIESAGPGTPVEVDGWKDQPIAGDEVLQADTEQEARSAIDIRLEALERTQLASDMIAVNEARRLEQERREAQKAAEAAAEAAAQSSQDPDPTPSDSKATKETYREIPFLVKADVSGSVEAVLTSVLSLGNASIRPTVIRSGVGPVSEFDVSHAASAQAHIVCFNVGMDQNIRRLAEAASVTIVEQNIIYRLVDAVKSVLEEQLEPLVTKRVTGEAEVVRLFDISVGGRRTVSVAGCKVRNGVIGRGSKVLVRRGTEIVFNGMWPTSLFSFPLQFLWTHFTRH